MPLVGINLKDLNTQKIIDQAGVKLQSILPPMIEELLERVLKDRVVEVNLKIRFRDKETGFVMASGNPVGNPVDPTA